MLGLLLFELLPSQYLGEWRSKAFAAPPVNSMTAPIDYNGTGADANGKHYSKYDYMSGAKVDITVPSGKTIKRIFHDGDDVTPPSAIGVNNYKGPLNDIHAIGSAVPVVSRNNALGTQGYYAWFRYIPTDPHKYNWYADVKDGDGATYRINCGPSLGTSDGIHYQTISAPTESVNGHSLPTVPYCASNESAFVAQGVDNLGLDSIIEQSYKSTLDNSSIPYAAVVPDVSSGAAVVNELVGIPGPTGPGKARAETIDVVRVKSDSSDASKFRVIYNQRFTDFVPPFDSQQTPDPGTGAMVKVWFAAFIVDVQGSTYEYKSTVDVEYETPQEQLT